MIATVSLIFMYLNFAVYVGHSKSNLSMQVSCIRGVTLKWKLSQIIHCLFLIFCNVVQLGTRSGLHCIWFIMGGSFSTVSKHIKQQAVTEFFMH
jgi:hypothetical protein